MLLFSGALGVFAFAVWVFCIVDVITSSGDQVRNLPKLLWLLLVVLLIDIGSIAWLIAGRPWSAKVPVGAGVRAKGGRARPTNPDDAQRPRRGAASPRPRGR